MNASTHTTNPSIDAKRFTLDGSDELEHRLELACKHVLDSIRRIVPGDKLETLLLGGGYGRGEGGVLKTPGGDEPYNDLEFYVFINGNQWLSERRYGGKLHVLEHELAPEVGIEVEFKILSLDKLRRSAPSMFYYDLLSGHRRLFGGEKCLEGCEKHLEARNIPLSEATRLLMNRYSGLLFARTSIEHRPFTSQDADFVGRNHAKTQLALGDAVLTVFGQYHWSCRERHERLKRLAALHDFPHRAEICHHHAMGMEFKLHPVRTTNTAMELLFQHNTLSRMALKSWLWLESHRLGTPFHSAHEYALSPVNKQPGTNPWRNQLVNAKAFGPAALLKKKSRRHPREKVLNSLALLLWAAAGPNGEKKSGLATQFEHPVKDIDAALNLYKQHWNHCK